MILAYSLVCLCLIRGPTTAVQQRCCLIIPNFFPLCDRPPLLLPVCLCENFDYWYSMVILPVRRYRLGRSSRWWLWTGVTELDYHIPCSFGWKYIGMDKRGPLHRSSRSTWTSRQWLSLISCPTILCYVCTLRYMVRQETPISINIFLSSQYFSSRFYF